MNRITLPLAQIESVATALALAYDDCRIVAEMYEDAESYGVYEMVPVGREDGIRRQEARTLISNSGMAHWSALSMLDKVIANTLGEQNA